MDLEVEVLESRKLIPSPAHITEHTATIEYYVCHPTCLSSHQVPPWDRGTHEKGYEIAGVGKFGGGQGKGSVATEPHSNQKS